MAIIKKLPAKEPESAVATKEARYRRFNKDHDDSNWLISYADMMTLLYN